MSKIPPLISKSPANILKAMRNSQATHPHHIILKMLLKTGYLNIKVQLDRIVDRTWAHRGHRSGTVHKDRVRCICSSRSSLLDTED